MSISAFTRLRGAICALLLLAILATLLPAQRAAAQQNVVLGREEVNNVFYRWLFERPDVFQKRAIAVEDLIRTGLVLHTPNYDSAETLRQLDEFEARYFTLLGPGGNDAEYRANLPYATIARAMFDAALQTPALKDSVEQVYRELNAETSTAIAGGQYNAQERVILETIQEGITSSNAYRTLLAKRMDAAQARAKADPKFAKLWDEYFVSHTEYSIADIDALAFLAEHPEAPIPQQVRDAIRPDGSMEISLADLQQLARDEFGRINASIDDMQKTLVTISAQQGELVDFMRNEQARREAEALAEAKAQEHQLKLQAASSSVFIVSTLVGLKYPERGKQIAVVGQSLIKVGDSLTGYVKTVAGMSALGASLSTVVLTGNVLGAVINIVSLFGPKEPPPEQIILEEIGKLRQQVNELRTEMHTRFDRVDAQLNTIYSTMHQRFDQIDIKLGKITGSLEEIQQSLLTLSLALNRMERNNFEYLDALGRRPLREAINGALGYQPRTGLEMPYQPEFVTYENTFHSWGTLNAFDALSAGPTERDYSDAAVLAELSAAPLDANLNYLNGWLVAHGMQPFANRRLAGLRDWTFASRAYADLGLDWPAHLKRINLQRQAALDAVGDDLEQALLNISTIDTPSGPQGNGPLFSGVSAYYTSKLQALDQELLASEVAFARDVQTSLQREVPFALYGGLDQSLPYRPAEFSTWSCGGRYSFQLATPHNLRNMVSSYDRFALADYLGVSPLQVCFGYDWVDVVEECYPTPYDCAQYGKLKVRLAVVSENVLLARSEVVGDPQKISGDIAESLTRAWPAIKRRFETLLGGMTQPIPLTPEGAQRLETVSGELASKLAELQRAHSNRVLIEVTRGPLQASVVELAGAKKLLESFVVLGMPQAMSSDDLLRSLLFSKEELIDGQQLASFYAPATLSVTEAPSGAQLTSSPRSRLLQTGQKRSDALAKLLSDYLGGISTATYREDNTLVAGARFDLVMARIIADPNAPRPGQGRFIFLPLLRR